jgi:N-acetylneuraminic acid mutarotase
MKEAEELVEKGEAERTFDGLFREVAKPDKATKKTAKKAEYSTKDMKAED